MKRTLALFLSLLMAFGLFSGLNITAGAADNSGTTGDCAWEFDAETETLTVSGEGAMDDYEWNWDFTTYYNTPWRNYRTGIKNVVIGDGVTYIGQDSFARCENCSTVTIGNSVKTIGREAFDECDLTEVVIPDSVETIADSAFYWNKNLSDLTLGNSVTSIGKYAFQDCALTEVTIPATVTEIGDHALGYRYVTGEYMPVEGFTIKGYSGTTAETYANENGFKFVDLDTSKLTVTSNSNFYGTKSVVYQDNIPSQVIIDYYCGTREYWAINGHWELNYDPKVLQLSDASNKQNRKYTLLPSVPGGIAVNNMPESGRAVFNFSYLDGADLCDENGNPIPFVHLVFDVVGTGSTVVELETKQLVFMESGQAYDPALATVFNSESADCGKAVRDQLISDGAEIYTVIQPDGGNPVSDSVFVITGSSNWLNGWSPDIDEYVMMKNGDGTYEITVPDVPATKTNEIYAVKVVEYVGGDEHDQKWHGMDGTGLNYEFGVSAPGDVTVTYDPETGIITVAGPTVIEPMYKIDYITAVGNGNGNWLNGEVWEPDAESNRMTEVIDGVYMIYYKDVPTDLSEYSFKFAVNGGWDINWGYDLEEVTFGAIMPATYNGNNITFNGDVFPETEDTVDITLILDLTKMDWSKKTGAVVMVAPGQVNIGIPGDVNGDNNVDVLDAVIVQKYAADKLKLTDNQLYVADVNADNNVDILDAVMIQKYAVGKITEFKKKA